MTLALLFPTFDPIAISLGPLQIRWYSLAYVFGLLFGMMWGSYLRRYFPLKLPTDIVAQMPTWLILGVLLGGRLGFVLLYQPEYFLSHPLEIFKIWKGGMSFHGGFVGILVALWMYAKKQGVPFSVVLDLTAAAIPIGLGLGRIANFINGELWGRTSDLPWAMIFPHVDAQPRHPSQIYEFLLEGGLLFTLIAILILYFKVLRYPFFVSGFFSLFYGFFRFLVEFVREPERTLEIMSLQLTFGQIYSLPLMAFGCFLLFFAYKKRYL